MNPDPGAAFRPHPRPEILGNTPGEIDRAAALLAAGGLVAFPTETVYGLGADATSSEAVAKLYAAKGRPHFNPLIAHVGSIGEAHRLARFEARAQKLAERFWPGPLTLVLESAPGSPICDLARAGLSSIALRVPAHPIARGLIAAAGVPIVAPSANRSGHVSASDPAHVLADLAASLAAIIADGASPIGLESTILSVEQGRVRLLRPGGLARAAIEEALGEKLEMAPQSGAAPLAPGMLASHYAPRATLRLDAAMPEADEAFLGFGPDVASGAPFAGSAARNLSPAGDLVEAAANLYRYLRELDASGALKIAVAPIPATGLGEAIRDRLARAAAPR